MSIRDAARIVRLEARESGRVARSEQIEPAQEAKAVRRDGTHGSARPHTGGIDGTHG